MATQDLTTGGTAQPWNAHEAVSIVPFSYSAVDNPAASGDDLKVLALPEDALLIGLLITVTAGEGTDTIDIGFAAAGTTVKNSWTIATGDIDFVTPTRIPASGGVWIHADAALTTLELEGKAVVAYTNL